MKVTALWLLAAGMAAQFTWRWAPDWAQADVWNAQGSVLIVMLLGLMAASYRSKREFVLVCCYLGALWILTAGCSLLWLKDQWEVLPGQDQCDARVRFPLSVTGLFIGLLLLIRIRRAPDAKGPKS